MKLYKSAPNLNNPNNRWDNKTKLAFFATTVESAIAWAGLLFDNNSHYIYECEVDDNTPAIYNTGTSYWNNDKEAWSEQHRGEGITEPIPLNDIPFNKLSGRGQVALINYTINPSDCEALLYYDWQAQHYISMNDVYQNKTHIASIIMEISNTIDRLDMYLTNVSKVTYDYNLMYSTSYTAILYLDEISANLDNIANMDNLTQAFKDFILSYRDSYNRITEKLRDTFKVDPFRTELSESDFQTLTEDTINAFMPIYDSYYNLTDEFIRDIIDIT